MHPIWDAQMPCSIICAGLGLLSRLRKLKSGTQLSACANNVQTAIQLTVHLMYGQLFAASNHGSVHAKI